MKTSLFLIGSLLLLSSCTGSGLTNNHTPTAETSYITRLETISSKIKDTTEFSDCLTSAVNMCTKNVTTTLAQRDGSPELCNELDGDEEINGCKFAIVTNQATKKDDPVVCDTLSDKYQTQCYQSIYRARAIRTKNLSVCEQIDANSTALSSGAVSPTTMNRRDDCKLGVISSDPSSSMASCKILSSPDLITVCENLIKTRKNTPTK